MGRINVVIGDIVLERVLKYVTYTLQTIQKEILHTIVNRVIRKISEEVVGAKFYILINEAKDSSNKE